MPDVPVTIIFVRLKGEDNDRPYETLITHAYEFWMQFCAEDKSLVLRCATGAVGFPFNNVQCIHINENLVKHAVEVHKNSSKR